MEKSPPSPSSDHVTLDPFIAPLVPMFLENRTKDLELMEQLLAARDFTGFMGLGHKMRGAGLSYGFTKLGHMAGELEEAATAQDVPRLRALIDGIAHHLDNLEITYQT
jgi:HPt (histidine-containing phosphotransfer) domain-containing protein